jgi:hypothetical protein
VAHYEFGSGMPTIIGRAMIRKHQYGCTPPNARQELAERLITPGHSLSVCGRVNAVAMPSVINATKMHNNQTVAVLQQSSQASLQDHLIAQAAGIRSGGSGDPSPIQLNP